jgi:hypothetical protein
LLFSKRDPRVANYALASTATIAVLSQLRRQAFPLAIEIPRFTPRSRAAVMAPEWLGRLPRSVARQALFAAAFAALVLVLVTTIPAWATFHRGGSAASATVLRSSAGVTGTAATRVSSLSATTFVGDIPFVQQLRYFDSLTSSAPLAATFVQGAREATLASYLQDIGTRMALPYLNDAVANKQALDAWSAAVQEAQRQAAVESARRSSAVLGWESPPITGGTELASTVTFYACVGNGFCGNMASGVPVFPGAAACSSNMPLGTRFVIGADPGQTVFTCMDRGALSPTWVDIWFYDASDGWSWQSNVGTSSEITILP